MVLVGWMKLNQENMNRSNKMTNTFRKDIRLVVNNYSGVFYYKSTSGRWIRFNKIGNTQIAEEMLLMFKRVGHNTEIVDKTEEE